MQQGRAMKINGKDDIDVPLAFVMQVLADFQSWERAALRRGIEVERTDRLSVPGPGASWTIRFSYRGKPRIVDLRIAEMDASGRIAVAFEGKSAQGTATLVPLTMSPRRTRLSVSLDVQARTLAARLLFQSMRLARQRVVRKFEQRLAKFGAEIEARFKATGA
jgi:carbon monoxide dehydrogenase subunit G